MVKRIYSLIASSILLFILFATPVSYANEIEPEINLFAGPIVYKTNVTTYETWSNYSRVSDNIKVNNGQTGSIMSSNSTSFSRVISGTTEGLTIATNKTITSTIGYTLSTSTPGTWYMAFRVRYMVETGTRNYQPGNGGPVRTNTYTVKVPLYGQYTLIKY